MLWSHARCLEQYLNLYGFLLLPVDSVWLAGWRAGEHGADRRRGGRAAVHVSLVPVAALGLEEQHGVAALDRLAHHPVAVVGGRRADHAQARGVREVRLRALLVVLDRADVSAVRHADDDREVLRSLMAVGELGQLRGDLT